LELPDLWHQVHNRLIVAIADAITPQIVPKYRVAIEERIYTSIDDSLLLGIADVAVSRRDSTRTGATVTATRLAEPTPVKVPVPEQVTERFLEVRSTQTGAVVSVIEILSPKNEPIVDLQQLVNDIYERARFDLAIDYSQPVKPALAPEDAIWVREILASAIADE
jgi:hypothetical protein